MQYYDVTFHQSTGRTITKRGIPSDAAPFDVWKDACVNVTADELQLIVNDGKYITLLRSGVVAIDVEPVEDPIEKDAQRRDEIASVINTLSNMGF